MPAGPEKSGVLPHRKKSPKEQAEMDGIIQHPSPASPHPVSLSRAFPIPVPDLPSALLSRLELHLPVLITGLPGVPGYNAFLGLRALFGSRILGQKPPHAQGLDAEGIHTVDPADLEAVSRLMDRFGIRSVLDATGWCALKACEYDLARARLLNITHGLTLAEAAKRHSCRFIRLSTDLVFSGEPYLRGGEKRLGDYAETDPVSPVTVYGKCMAEAEEAILSLLPGAAVLRTSLPMGASASGHAGAVDWIDSRFRMGRPATLYFDEIRRPIAARSLNAVLAHFLANGAAGIFHVGGGKALSLYRIGEAVLALGGYAPGLLQGCMRAEAGPVPPRAGDVSMDCSKVMRLLPPGTLGAWP